MKNSQVFLKKSRWKINGRLFGFGDSPESDWKIIFISTIILAVLVVTLSVFMFIEIYQEGIFVTEEPPVQKEKAINVSVLKETVLYYQNKALEFEKIKSLVTPAVDPSL